MKKGEKRGFTIIEVSLVLAIAGLIMMMVFVALPALQRSQRDTQRKDDVAKLVKAIKDYQTNNRGALPTGTTGTEWKNALKNYLGGNFEDPGGSEYVLNVKDCAGKTDKTCGDYGASKLTDNNMYIITAAKCSESDTAVVVGSSNPRRFAVLYKMEVNDVYCQSS